MNSDFAALAALGAMSGAAAWASSGAAAWALVPLMDFAGLHFGRSGWDVLFIGPLNLVPGLVFGLVIGFLLRRRGGLGAARQVGYVLAAGLGYFAAVHIAIYSGGELARLPFPAALLIRGMLGGLAGSVLLGVLTVWLLRVPAALALRWPVVTGSVAGGLLSLFALDDHSEGASLLEAILLAFFVLWQGAYAASLAPLLRVMRVEREDGRADRRPAAAEELDAR